MVKYTTEVKKLFREGITRAKEEEMLPATFKKRVIPIGRFISYY